MSTGADTGFTLVEVLMAMVILFAGMMAIASLGTGAARSLARAEQGTELVVSGTAAMEKTQQKVRALLLVATPTVTTGRECATEPGGLRVCTQVDTRASLASLSSGNARIRVTVSAGERPENAFTITSYVFDPHLP